MIAGADFSYCQKNCDYSQLRSAGVEFAWVKCTDWSPTHGFFVDEMYETHTAGLRAQGTYTGAYAFAHVTPSPIDHADFFLKNADLNQLLPVLDMETTMPDNSIPKNAGAWALAWMQRVSQTCGFDPILYGSTSYLEECLRQAPGLGKYKVWLAEYHIPASPDHLPRVKAPLQQTQIVVWQWSGSGKLPGCPMPIDRSVLVGSDFDQICC